MNHVKNPHKIFLALTTLEIAVILVTGLFIIELPLQILLLPLVTIAAHGLYTIAATLSVKRTHKLILSLLVIELMSLASLGLFPHYKIGCDIPYNVESISLLSPIRQNWVHSRHPLLHYILFLKSQLP